MRRVKGVALLSTTVETGEFDVTLARINSPIRAIRVILGAK